MSSGTIISEATDVCLQSFTNCLEVEELLKDEWAENRLADFNLWVSGTGALAGRRASLDHRLRTKPEACAVIANLLRLLAGTVDECKNLSCSVLSGAIDDNESGEGSILSPESLPERAFSPWSDDSLSDDSASEGQPENQPEPPLSSTPLHENMQSIEAILGQLARIAISVRQSGKRSRLQRADHLFKPEDHEDLRNHLGTIILARGEFSQQQIDLSNLDEIQQRLVFCNLKRRNRFLYAQRHSIRLNPVVPAPTTQERTVEKLETSFGGERKPMSPLWALKTPGKAPSTSINRTIRTGTSASAISETFGLPQAPLPPTAASTVVSSTTIDLKYPRPPEVKDGAHVFKCPCCCQILPVSVLEGNKWKKHVADDLCPYTCILSDCSNPTQLFVTAKSWRLHILEAHYSFTYWICFSCEQRKQFRTEQDLTTHIKENHAATIPYDRIPLLADISKRSAPLEITSCPLCDWPEKEGQGISIDKDTLLDHIAKDLHAFSLRSLPWADGNGQEDDKRIRYSSDKVYDWLIGNELFQSHSEERPPLEGGTFSSEYFQHNPYFAANSASSNSSRLESLNSREEELENWKQEDSNEFENKSESPGTLGDEITNWKGETDIISHKSSIDGELELKDIVSIDDGLSDWKTSDPLSLILAAKAGDVATVEKLLHKGSEIEATDNNGRTALFRAAQEGKENTVKLLLERGADIETKDIDGRTPLLSMCHTGMEAVAKLLIEYGADVNATDKNGWTPLFWAVCEGKVNAIRLLLEKGADIEARDVYGCAPIFWAVYNGNRTEVQLLLEQGADVRARDKNGCTPLLWAAFYGNKAAVELLLLHNADIEARDPVGHTPLHLAAYVGHEYVIRSLIGNAIGIEARDKDGFTPLLVAVYNGREAIVRQLLLGGANSEAKDIGGWTPLLWAAYKGYKVIAKLLVEQSVKTKVKYEIRWTPLRWAVHYGKEAIVKLLVDAGVADVNPIDENNKTLVSCAAEYGHDNIVRILLRTGKIDLRANNNGSWLLHWAAAANDEEMITLLLDKGVDLDAKDFKDRTALWAAVYEGKSKAVKVFMKRSTALYSNLPDEEDILFLAAYEGDTETVESLLLRGINPQATDRWGAQPLHWAAYNGHEEVAKLFLTHGANVNALNPDDCTPLYLAIHMLNKAVVKTLLDAGADPSIPDRWGLSYSKEQCLRFTDQKHSAEHNLA